MPNYLKLIKHLLIPLEKKAITKAIIDMSTIYNDESKLFAYNATVCYPKKSSNKIRQKNTFTAHGRSSVSREMALLKCLGEAIERYCLYYHKDDDIYSSFSNIKQEALDPSIYINHRMVKIKKISWIKGYNITKNINTLIPAQLVYLSNLKNTDEVRLSEIISTGAAGGFTHESALLRGMYEVIERDAFMTMYLLKGEPTRINTDTIKNKTINKIVDTYRKYRLDVLLFDITNDLQIPTFLTILIDKTGLGPAICLGLKTGLNIKEAIIGSLEEASLPRSLGRGMLDETNKEYIINQNSIHTIKDRALYWLYPKMFTKIKFLLDQPPIVLKTNYLKKYKEKEEFEIVKGLLEKKGFQIYYADITLNFFRKSNYLVYKVVIPALQPLYLDEKYKILILDRLKTVSKFYNQKKITINNVPHPFL